MPYQAARALQQAILRARQCDEDGTMLSRIRGAVIIAPGAVRIRVDGGKRTILSEMKRWGATFVESVTYDCKHVA
jgi:hypothetical protein